MVRGNPKQINVTWSVLWQHYHVNVEYDIIDKHKDDTEYYFTSTVFKDETCLIEQYPDFGITKQKLFLVKLTNRTVGFERTSEPFN